MSLWHFFKTKKAHVLQEEFIIKVTLSPITPLYYFLLNSLSPFIIIIMCGLGKNLANLAIVSHETKFDFVSFNIYGQ